MEEPNADGVGQPGEPMPKWKIRRASTEDAAALVECIDAAYSAYASKITDLPAVSEGIAEHIEQHIVWVAELDSTVVGGVVLIPRDRFMLLANVVVRPENSGLGIGRALIELADEVCLEHGLSELRLSTHTGLPENVGLYKHLGWVETGRSGNKVQMRKLVDS